MKIIQLISGREYLIEDEECEYIKSLIKQDKKLIGLSNGDVINLSSISVMGEPEEVPYWDGYQLNKDGKSFMENGRRVYLDAQHLEQIEYFTNPKYQAMPKVSVLRLTN